MPSALETCLVLFRSLATALKKWIPKLELGFHDDFEDLENLSEMVAETSQVSKDQLSESATR